MTKAERERKALEYPCPLCHAQAHFRCRTATRQIKRRQQPHLQRVALVKEN